MYTKSMWLDIWQLLGGVGLLIFGMTVLEHALYAVAGNKLKDYLQRYTRTTFLAVIVGWLTTLIMSGSWDIVTLLTMALVSAGIIKFRSWLGIIFWSNIGATSLPLIVSLFGFGKFDFLNIALPLIAVGGILSILIKSEKIQQIAKGVVWFSLLFVAVEWMWMSMIGLENSFDISQYKDMSLRGFGLLWAILAAVIQSGWAIGIITITALEGGVITFAASIAIMMWVNIWTTNTPMIAAFGGRREKLQVWVSHILFNFISWIIGVIFFRQYVRLWQHLLWGGQDTALGSAFVNFWFNTSTAILFALFIGPFERLIKKIVPIKNQQSDVLITEELQQANLYHHSYTTPYAIAFRKDTRNFIREVIELTDKWIKQRLIHQLVNEPTHESYDSTLTDLYLNKAKKLLDLATKLQHTSKSDETIDLIDQCKLSVRQCFHALELISRTDTWLQNENVHLPKNLAFLKLNISTKLDTILQEIYHISNHEDAQPVQHITVCMENIKSLRLEILTALVKNPSTGEWQDEASTQIILFTQRLYQIVKKLLAALDYAFLLKSEQAIAEHEIG